jgi:hypothetical protein
MEPHPSTSRMTRGWFLPLLVAAGMLWALMQLLWTAVAAPTARGGQLTQCGQDLDYGLLTGLTACVLIMALVSVAFTLARHPGRAGFALGAEALLALVWWTSDTAGGGVGCIIG